MLDADTALRRLEAFGLGDWSNSLRTLIESRLQDSSHGDLPRWRETLAALPTVARTRGRLTEDAIATGALEWRGDERERARAALLDLKPWRKGPFEIADIRIDSEWRSNLKWDRVLRHASAVENRRVLDAGCGNGYYALRMVGAGASSVVGVDPTLLHLAQFDAVSRFIDCARISLLPLRLEELPRPTRPFDTAFSMGVLYHARAPIDHLRILRDMLRPGGELVLETLVLPGDEASSRVPPGRYARMRNVWHLPTVTELAVWLDRSGFADPAAADISVTTPDEQRSTDWMPFESLAEALDADDPGRTVEGWPAPRRALVIATRPG